MSEQQPSPQVVFNALMQSIQNQRLAINEHLLTRQMYMSKRTDPRRDIAHECGHPTALTIDNYYDLHERNGLASRVNYVFPDESWAMPPDVYESESAAKTEFEQDWDSLNPPIAEQLGAAPEGMPDDDSEETPNVLQYLHRVDRESGIFRFGALLFGFDDIGANGDLSDPVPGVDAKPRRGRPPKLPEQRQLLYLRAFGGREIRIAKWDEDPSSPRCGRPEMYDISFMNTQAIIDGINALPMNPESTTITRRNVHWTRILHVADNRGANENVGTPRSQQVFNYLLDLYKVISGSGEMYWQAALPGIAFEMLPELAALGVELTADQKKSISDEIWKYFNHIQRYMSLQGMKANQLSPQVVSPSEHFTVLIQALCATLGIPLRIFLGSEVGKLASTQDAINWKSRLAARRQNYLTPFLIRPCVKRLIAAGVIRRPKSGRFIVRWPDLNTMTDKEKADIALKKSTALMNYRVGGISDYMTFRDYLVYIVGVTPAEAAEIVKNSGIGNKTVPALTTVAAAGSGGNSNGKKPKNPAPSATN
jgi:hypothetical protein